MRRAALARPLRAVETGLGARVSTPEEAHEREADRVADQVLAGPRPAVTPLLPRGGGIERSVAAGGSGRPASRLSGLGGGGAPLSVGLRGYFEPRFGRDLSAVRVHSGPSAAALAGQVDARAFAHGSDIYFGRGEYAPQTPRGLHLLAHEITHTLQPGPAERLNRKTLTDIPEATRTKLRVSRVAPPQADVDTWIGNYFNPKSGVTRTPGATIEFGTEISDPRQQAGFKGVAGELEFMSEVHVIPASGGQPEQRTNTDPEAYPLAPGMILDLAMDLRPQGGEHAIFRFIHYVDGRDKKILVERLHILAPAPVPPATGGATQAPGGQGKAPTQAPPQTQTQAPPQQQPGGVAPSFTGDVTVGAIKVKIDSSFGDARGKQLVDAISLLPDPIRAKVDGVTFQYMGGTKGPDGRAGDYQEDKDTIRVFGDMFNASPYRIGKGTQPQYGIVHELGHVIDRRPLFNAQRARDKATETRKKLQRDLDNPPPSAVDPLGERTPARLEEEVKIREKIRAAQSEIDAQNAAMATARSIAGEELGEGRPSEQMLTDFARALDADGVKPVTDALKTNRQIDEDNRKAAKENAENPTGPQKAIKPNIKTLRGASVTDYAATNLMEAFAENFAIYILDEALLRAIRPNTFAYFARAFPKTVAPPAARTP